MLGRNVWKNIYKRPVCTGQLKDWEGWASRLQKQWSFWDRQKQHSFCDRPHLGLQTSWHLPTKGEVSPRRALPGQVREPPWVPDPSETSLLRWECGLQKLHSSGTGRSDTASGTVPVSGHHLQPGGRAECQISVHFPCKRRACLQRVLWSLRLRRKLDFQVCWQSLTESQGEQAPMRDNYNNELQEIQDGERQI